MAITISTIVLTATLAWQVGDPIAYDRFCTELSSLIVAVETGVADGNCFVFPALAQGVMVERVVDSIMARSGNVGPIWKVTQLIPYVRVVYIFARAKQ